MSEMDAVKYKIDNLIGIHSRDGYYTAALLTPDDLTEIKERIAAVEANSDRLRAAAVKVLGACDDTDALQVALDELERVVRATPTSA